MSLLVESEKSIKSVKGMNDCLPADEGLWQCVENTLKNLFSQAGYNEIRTPLLEHTNLFKRTIGNYTDVVTKEMYTFDDYGESLTLRPEGTAGCVRACIEHGLTRQIQKLWYLGPMFRHEKPQKGRYRQFHQFGVEIFGVQENFAELELLLLMNAFLKKFGLTPYVKLQINSLGTTSERFLYKEKLVEYLKLYENDLDEDSKNRLYTNPLRILDSKNTHTQEIIKNAPLLQDHLTPDSIKRFESLQTDLSSLDIEYTVNYNLVRGLDYYSHTVFEFVTNELGSQGTVCAGGRYDKLVELLGGAPTPAVGFAVGIERIILLLQELSLSLNYSGLFRKKIFVMSNSGSCIAKMLKIMQDLREKYPDFIFINYLTDASLKSQFKKADKINANYAIIMGEQELSNNMVTVKNLRRNEEQQTLSMQALYNLLDQI